MHTSYLVDLLSILSMHTIRTIRMHTLLILASSSRSTRVCILATLVVRFLCKAGTLVVVLTGKGKNYKGTTRYAPYALYIFIYIYNTKSIFYTHMLTTCHTNANVFSQ